MSAKRIWPSETVVFYTSSDLALLGHLPLKGKALLRADVGIGPYDHYPSAVQDWRRDVGIPLRPITPNPADTYYKSQIYAR